MHALFSTEICGKDRKALLRAYGKGRPSIRLGVACRIKRLGLAPERLF